MLTLHSATITGRFLSDKCLVEEGGGGGNQTEQYLSLGVCHLSSTLQARTGMTVGGGFRGGLKGAAGVGMAAVC